MAQLAFDHRGPNGPTIIFIMGCKDPWNIKGMHPEGPD